ncbi:MULTISPECIES: LysR family transcriptional regulator [unclassified Mesorhizobium]|uniref:LysR family transcriptional regulator n=1 Tax=unclassified Mesorhizobium TaxID=325217 RepID=UPI000FCA33D1|nr:MULTISPECIES: LysR family transcriptional regulator [unclassified Mesorhizobium]RUW74463.1 LysR family transcriptional regulator [Mesorhizobium sp. M1E.F.Ca.ET.063.01.1.1]RWA78197.1 MAG: LysR family transcriptional regulator [Mesorhizobium sp.]TIS47420.1 MAG: LysR family transcriptional regulator [Mesorhizobium sp.]
MRKYQSLTALRAFEAVARFKSISAAAGELNVTRPAVSKQVTLLENDMGCALLTRSGNAIRLTPAGNELFLALRQAFVLIHSTTEAISRRAKQGQHLRVLVCRDFASSWLAGQVGTFLVANPGISVEIFAEKNGNFRLDEDFDFRIFYGMKGATSCDGFEETQLCHWIDMLVCTETFAGSYIGKGRKLCEAPCLVDANYDVWDEWCALTGIDPGGPRGQQTVFNETTLCLSVAASGGGLTVGDSFLSLPAIRTGELIVPHQVGLVSAQHYALLKPQGRSTGLAGRKFEAWLRGAIEAYQVTVLQVLSEKAIQVRERPISGPGRLA